MICDVRLEMEADFEKMLDLMEVTFRGFEEGMPNPPQWVKYHDGYTFRFQEKDIYQAIIQKLARVQSCVRAAYLLHQYGFVQEQAMLHRIIDETNEDILFLSYAISEGEITPLHERYLDAFWEEEIDASGDALKSEQKRVMPTRRKVRAYIANVEGVEMDPSTGVELGRTISKAYSGFIHGASPHIMDMYGGHPPHFHTQGMLGTPRVEELRHDLWNYMYRSFLSHIVVAKILGAEKHVEILLKHKKVFEDNAGKEYE